MLTKTPFISIVCVLMASILGAVGQFLFQYGANKGKSGIGGFLTNPYILIGMAGYIAVMVLFTYAFRLGGTVKVLYPIYASTFIWAAIIAWLRYNQGIYPIHIAGMVLLIAGIICMSWEF